jgi:hypothetical protein
MVEQWYYQHQHQHQVLVSIPGVLEIAIAAAGDRSLNFGTERESDVWVRRLES